MTGRPPREPQALRAPLLTAIVLALAGCGSAPTTTFYTLVPPVDAAATRASQGPVPDAPSPSSRASTSTSTSAPASPIAASTNAAATAALSLSLSIGPVSVPESVDRPQFVVRDGPTEQRLLEQRRWSQSLPREIDGALRAHLARRLPGARITIAGQSAAAEAQWRLALDVQRFEATRGRDTVFEALWTLRDRNGAPIDSGRFVDQRTVADSSFDALAASQAASIERLAQVIAERVAGRSPI